MTTSSVSVTQDLKRRWQASLMDNYGTTILGAEIALLAVATVGAIWLDHAEGERIRRQRAAERAAGERSGADEP